MFYVSGDARLFYETLGTGPDVVLLHPTPVHHEFWMPITLGLQTGYRVTLPDLRGHGQSEAGHGVIGLSRLGEDIERLLDAAHIERALFAGCSIGSYTLYELWRRIPGRIRGLAWCCGKPQPDTPANRAKRAGIGSEPGADFFRLGLPCARQFRRAQLMIAAQED